LSLKTKAKDNNTGMKPYVYAAWVVIYFGFGITSVSVNIAQLFVLPVLYRHLRYYSEDGLDGQWTTYTVKSNYFRFATITLNFTQLSNIVDFKLSDNHCG